MPESEILLKYTTDKRSLDATLTGGERLTSAQRAYRQEVLEANAATKKAYRALEDYRDAVEEITAAEKEAQQAIAGRVQAQGRGPTKPKTGGGSTPGGYDVVSQQVERFGDAESQLRTLTGALGYVGGAAGQTAEQLINVGAELFAVTEAGPKLVASIGEISKKITDGSPILTKFAQTLANNISALSAGTEAEIAAREALKAVRAGEITAEEGLAAAEAAVGTAAAGSSPAVAGVAASFVALAVPVLAVTAAIGGLILILKAIGDAAEEAGKRVQDEIDADREGARIAQEIREFERNADREGAQAKLEQLQLEQELDQAALDSAREHAEAIKKEYEALGAAFNPQRRAELGKEGQVAEENVKKNQELVEARQREIDALTNAIPGIKDAKAEEEALAAAREGGTDAAKAAEKAEASRQKAVEDAERQIQQAQEKAQAAQDNYNKAVQDAARTARNAAQDVRTKLRDALIDLGTNARRQAVDDAIQQNQEVADLRRKQYDDEMKAIRDHNRALRDVIKNAGREQQDLLAERDFLALDQLSKRTEREIEDQAQAQKDAELERQFADREELRQARQQYDRLRQERAMDFSRQLQDTRQNAERELRDVQTAKRRQLEQARDALNNELEMARRGIETKLQLEARYWQQSAAMIPGAGGGTTAAGAGSQNIATMQNVARLEALNVFRGVGF